MRTLFFICLIQLLIPLTVFGDVYQGNIDYQNLNNGVLGLWSDKGRCTGTKIHHNYIIMAQHSTSAYRLNSIIKMSNSSLLNLNAPQITARVEGVYTLNNFESYPGGWIVSDISVLKVSIIEGKDLWDNIISRKVDVSDIYGKEVTVWGYGISDKNADDYGSRRFKTIIPTKFLPREREYVNENLNFYTFNYSTKRTDILPGDSGGPIFLGDYLVATNSGALGDVNIYAKITPHVKQSIDTILRLGL